MRDMAPLIQDPSTGNLHQVNGEYAILMIETCDGASDPHVSRIALVPVSRSLKAAWGDP